MADVEERNPADVSKWIIAMTVILPTFIEVMDTSVVNVSLPHMQGSFSAGVDEVTWVLTSYLVSNAIIIPISGWLSSVFGRKRYLIFSIVLFIIGSVLCGAAPTLAVLVVARVLQGIGGGGLQPISQAILLESFPVEEHGMAMAIFGMGIVLAPIAGPVLGGWITDNWNWRWVFYINVPAGILAVMMAMAFIHDPSYVRKKGIRIDYLGLAFLTVGLGCLQMLLDKGERADWFASDFILTLGIISAAALIGLVFAELRSKQPVIDLRVFRDRTFAVGNLIMFTGFLTFFSAIVMLPLYLQKLMGYTAVWAGLVLGPGGLATLLVMPLAGNLMKKGVKPQRLLALGILISAYSLWLMSQFNLEADFNAVVWPRVVQAVGMALFFVPLAAATYVNIKREDMGNATGIFNLLRNLGGSIGVAFATTILSQRSQFHQTSLVEHLTPFNPAFQIRMQQLLHHSGQGGGGAAQSKGLFAFLYSQVLRHASMLGFNDTFWILGLLSILLVPLPFLMRARRQAY
jgi:MFS transporter, DHA2 family, multidrug resistance protein